MKTCENCAYYEEDANGWGYCALHVIGVKAQGEPCEKFKLNENDNERKQETC